MPQASYKEAEVFAVKLSIGIVILTILTLIFCSGCYADNYTDEEIVNAIYIAEGGAKTKYPYGILTKYKTTTPRQACFNTVKNNRKRYADYGYKQFDNYLDFLASRYCPIGAKNDPTNLNVNWLKNVKSILKKNKGGEK